MIFSNIKSKLINSKKGNAILDTAMVFIVLVVFGLFSIITWSVWGEISPDIYDSVNETDEATAALDVIDTRFPSLLDGLFIFIFLGLWIMTLVASWMIDTHPIFFAISLILFIIVLIGAIYLGNFYEEIITDTSFNSAYTAFPATHYILTNLLMFSIIIGSSIMIVLYGKSRT